MISTKVLLLVLALAGGLCGAVAINFYTSEDHEAEQRSEKLAVYCEHFKYSKNPFPGCEASHVGR